MVAAAFTTGRMRHFTFPHQSGRDHVRPGKVSEYDWAPEGALPTYSGCIEAARDRAERLGKVVYKSNVEHATFYPIMGRYRADWTYKSVEGHLSHAEFRCLPDTIDPRGPETK